VSLAAFLRTLIGRAEKSRECDSRKARAGEEAEATAAFPILQGGKVRMRRGNGKEGVDHRRCVLISGWRCETTQNSCATKKQRATRKKRVGGFKIYSESRRVRRRQPN